MELKDLSKANPERLKQLGAVGVVEAGNGLQAIFGTEVPKFSKPKWKNTSKPPAMMPKRPPMLQVVLAAAVVAGFLAVAADPQARARCENGWSRSAAQICRLAHRLRRNQTAHRSSRAGNYADREELLGAGVKGIMPLPDGIIHLLTGLNAHQYEIELQPC